MSQPLQATNSRGYFSSPRTLSRTAQKLQERGFLDADGARSVEHCIKIFHDDVNDVVVKALQPHLPTSVEGAQEVNCYEIMSCLSYYIFLRGFGPLIPLILCWFLTVLVCNVP